MDLPTQTPTPPPQQNHYEGLIPPESMGGPSSKEPASPAAVPPTVSPAASPSAVPPSPSPSLSPTSGVYPPAPGQGITPPPAASHHSGIGNWILIGFLIILLAGAILFFLSWKGMVSLGGLEKIWGGGGQTATPAVSATPTATTAATSDATRKRDLASLRASLKKYYADNGNYPQSSAVIKTSDTSSVLAQVLVPAYIAALPVDPASPSRYYGYKSDGKSFEISAVLDDKTDPSGKVTGGLNIYIVTDVSGE